MANRQIMKKMVLLLAITLGLTNFVDAQTTEVKPNGVFREIDVTRYNLAIEVLTNSSDQKLKQQAVDSILKNPNDYNPPVIYALSKVLFSQGKKDEAIYWFYVAQLRARYDANLCMDNSAKQAVSILNEEYGPDINQYAFKNLDKLEKTIKNVVAFVRANTENYDHRWINLHGMDAITAGIDDKTEAQTLSQPKDKWAEIKNRTIDEYYNGFVKYVKKNKK